ncbi:flagellar hook-basal body complex protein FliE [Pluralibacter sp.]|uniref:flagellar hook-basal body complex protein FliE n=1 Tax=Pluralibacter sp. TaxID=1920032 RepID=UPI0025F75728|nr:flagellar hook-basal body complex protein FliE [Pluralibacter sp.]
MDTITNTQQAMMQRMATMQIAAQQPLIAPQSQNNTQDTSFGQVFHAALNGVDRQQQEAANLATQIETGASDDLTGAMIASQKASLSFSALTQVRNKLMTAYDEVMKMPL